MTYHDQLKEGKEPVALRITVLTPSLGANNGLDYTSNHLEAMIDLCYIKDINDHSLSIERAGFYNNYFDDRNHYKDLTVAIKMLHFDHRISFQVSFDITTYSDKQSLDDIEPKVKACRKLQKKYDGICQKYGQPSTPDEVVSYLARAVRAKHFFYNNHSELTKKERLYESIGVIREKLNTCFNDFEKECAAKHAA